MTTDRELLELAAKASGYGLPGPDDNDEVGRQELDGLWVKFPWGWGWWRPLAHDGDALRLAVKLNLDVELLSDCVYANGSEVQNYQLFEWHKDDKCAATRRAIVRAAAEIGRNMK